MQASDVAIEPGAGDRGQESEKTSQLGRDAGARGKELGKALELDARGQLDKEYELGFDGFDGTRGQELDVKFEFARQHDAGGGAQGAIDSETYGLRSWGDP